MATCKQLHVGHSCYQLFSLAALTKYKYCILLYVALMTKYCMYCTIGIHQVPDGDTLLLSGPKTKTVLRIYSNESCFNSQLLLRARIDSRTIDTEHMHVADEYVVIYNSCCDSNKPQMFCKEAQVTILGENVTFTQVSFHLYDRKRRKQNQVSRFSLKQLQGKVSII